MTVHEPVEPSEGCPTCIRCGDRPLAGVVLVSEESSMWKKKVG
jgi:hypothetical protein